ncbi:hypothetical protein WJX72_002368 [[Myrmecia] bisecta]|uniref:Photosystem II 11 kDa protein n=1 Tax=[Myrmecia] bisecta TaxID=41462 RepID=A0AAW1Q244_9CHLO
MLASCSTVSQLQTSRINSTRQLKNSRSAQCVSRCAAVTRAQQGDQAVSRRTATLAGVAGVAALFGAAPARAGLFGGPSKEEAYVQETSKVLEAVKATLDLPKGDPGKEDAVNAVRKQTNDWVAKYRRDGSKSGRPSYGNTYSALNALAGHYNSFGLTAPLPKKRLERITKELADAEKALARGR